MTSRLGTIASLHRFPVKSMGGESIAEVAVDENGMVGDRTWAARDIETGKLVSAKRPRPWQAMLECTATGTGDDVVVTLPSGETYGIGDAGLTLALEALLGRSVSLEAATGPQQGTYVSEWPEIEGLTLSGEMEFPTNLTGQGTSFIDVEVFHFLTTASVDALAAATPDTDLDIRRFRPGFVVDTSGTDASGFVENEWTGSTVRIGSGDDAVEITVGDPSPRCIMTTLDQGGLPKAPEVLRTLAKENRITNPFGNFACLGVYATVARPGVIRTGDVVELL